MYVCAIFCLCCGFLKNNGLPFQLGINRIFTPNANLSDLLETRESLKVSDVVHKAFITVDEGGSEAAAATGTIFVYIIIIGLNSIVFFLGVKIVLLSGTFNAPMFRADHPFVYYIWDNNSKTIVFSGRVTNFN